MFKEGKYRNWILALLLTSCTQPPVKASHKQPELPVKVAIIDSGIDPTQVPKVRFCLKGHYDYINQSNEIGGDNTLNKHGTNIAKTVAEFSDGNYCLLIYRVVNIGRSATDESIADAINKAISNGAKIINLSLSSKGPDEFSNKEYMSLLSASESNIKIFIAAGNNSSDLDKNCDVYPACYKYVNTTVVGSIKTEKFKNESNYGSVVKQKEFYCYRGLCGTSISTAIASGKYVKILNNN